jgi:uncharacterized membrane protein (DUF485 family)
MFKYQLLESKRNKNSKIWANTIILLNLNFIKLTNFFKKILDFKTCRLSTFLSSVCSIGLTTFIYKHINKWKLNVREMTWYSNSV